MAKDKIDTLQNSQVDNETLLENMKGLELENKMLKEEKEKLTAEIEKANKTIEQTKADNAEEINSTVAGYEEQITNLVNERNDLATQIEDLKKLSTGENDALVKENKNLTEKYNRLIEDNQKLQEKYQSLQDHVSGLVEQNKKEPKVPERAVILNPFAFGILKRLRDKLAELYNKPELALNTILEDYLLKYNCLDKWTEWFHPFVLTDKEIVEEAQKVNPEIKNIKDLRKAANIQPSDEN